MFDAHSHLGKGSIPSFICSSKIEEYEEIIKKGGSIGLLPEHLQDQEVFFRTLQDNPHLNIGEVGLDRRYENRDEQIIFFKKCLQIAKERKKLLTVHCVRDNGLVVSLLKETPPHRFIWHSFTGSFETAKEIIALGGFISLGNTSAKSKDFTKLLSLPFLLESDKEAGQEQETSLKAIYKTVQICLNISEKELEKIIDERIAICKT